MKQTLYEISNDLLSIQELVDNCVDENGEPRELTEEEKTQIQEWFNESNFNFETKFDNYCRFIKNQKAYADICNAQYKEIKKEFERLNSRGKSLENRAKSLQELLKYNMELQDMNKFKSALFSATIQSAPLTVSAIEDIDLSGIPEKYLKPRELNTTAIKNAIKAGVLEAREDGKVYVVETGEWLAPVLWSKSKFIVIR